jgi:hypothetical protein
MIAVLSGTSAGAASTTFGGSAEGNAVAGETDGLAGAAALDDETFAVPVAADEGSAETAAAAFVAGVRG